MQPSLLEEIASVPNPYPIRSEVEYPEVWRLCEQARELAWNPLDLDFTDVREADLPREVREAGAEWWSLRAAWRSLFEAWDVVVAPVSLRQPYAHVPLEGSPIAAAAGLEIEVAGRRIPYGRPTFHPALATLPGLPATAFPVGLDDRGLPVGLQLIGPYLEDRSTIALAAQLERDGLAAFRPPPGFEDALRP